MILNKNIPITLALSHPRSRFLFWSRGVHMALKRLIIHTIENISTVIPKLPLISFLRSAWISFRLIPKFTKKLAWSGLKAIYARKLPKNIIAIRRKEPMSLSIVLAVSGSLVFFAVVLILGAGSLGDQFSILASVLGCIFDSWDVWIISSSRDDGLLSGVVFESSGFLGDWLSIYAI